MWLSAWAEPQMEMHRVQATTKDPSGWYLAASTHGAFSVLIPIPFNDFTVTAYMRHVKTPKSLILVILEYPMDQAKAADGYRAVFLSSLKISHN